MKLPRSARLLVLAAGVTGLITIGMAAFAGRHAGITDPSLFLGFSAVLALGNIFPLFLFHKGETEAFTVDEAFLVVMILLLAPHEAVLSFALGLTLGHIARRRGAIKTLFNAGVAATGAGLAVLTANAIQPMNGPISPLRLVAVLIGAAVFFTVQGTAVSVIIALAERQSPRRVFADGITIRVLVWLSNVSAGLLVGLVSHTYSWALLFAILPVIALQLAFAGHLRSRRDRERMNGLLETSLKLHASMATEEVETALAESAKTLLRCSAARFEPRKPVEARGQMATRVGSNGNGRWLVVSDRQGVESFDEADRNLLEAIAAIGSGALEKAHLYKQAADQRKQLADVVDSASDGIFAIDSEERLTLWSPSMETITGYRAGDMIGTKHLGALRPSDQEGRYVMTEGWTNNSLLPEGNLQIVTSAGGVRWLNCVFSPMPEGGYVVVARDVTAQKEIDDLKADFLGTISHELRTPLTPIQGFLQTLLKEGSRFGDKERKRFYEIMLAQSERLGRLVDQILDAVTLAGSERTFAPQALHWANLTGAVVELIRGQHPDREFIVDFEDGLPSALADEHRAEQVLANLLGNAVKYSPPGSPIRMKTRLKENEIVTTVFDRGPGVDPSDRDRIFEKFTRLGSHLTRSVGGVGLGLYISKRLVEGMGGRIWVEEAPEGGAAFAFTIPVHRPPRLSIVAERSA